MKEFQNGTYLKKDDPRQQRCVPLPISQIFDEITAKITSSESEWKSFLSFHARIYKYSFESAALIYAQRPDATLVADMETWNKKVGRWVKAGAKSIRVFDSDENDGTGNSLPRTRYLFDISDTIGNPETVPKVWSLNDTTAQMVADRLNNNLPEAGLPLEIVIGVMSEAKVYAAFDEWMQNFEDDLKNTSLWELPHTGVENCFRQAAVNSIIYLVGKRCGISDSNLDGFDLSIISHFKSKQLIARLGSGITRISQEILREIESTIKQILKEQRSANQYETSSGTELQRERLDHVPGHSELQQQGSRRDAAGQVRADGPVLPEGIPSPPLHIPSDGGRAASDNAQSERGGSQLSEYHHGTDVEERSDTRPERHLPELSAQDAADGNSGGNNPGGNRVQTEIKNISDTIESQNSGSFLIPINYRYSTEDEIGLGGLKTKFKNNVDAIKTLKVIESENRLATAAEQRILARYIGWGGMPQVFDPDASGWEKEYSELKSLLTTEEYDSARASTPNAHYTSPVVIEAIYKALERFGFEKGNILEPSMGTGLFYSLLPESMRESKLYGVELDSISGRIARQLYQTSERIW